MKVKRWNSFSTMNHSRYEGSGAAPPLKQLSLVTIGLKKTRKQMAAEMGISVKTLWGWGNDLWLPGAATVKLIAKGFPFDPLKRKFDS